MALDQSDEEYSKLAEQVQQVEKVLNLPGKAGEVGYLLKAFLLNAKTRMESIKGEVTTAKEHEKEEKSRERETALAQMVERESQLNSDEKREYGDLLKCEYFKKSDFGQLEHFYSKSYDKLTESGKDQMSQRVWAGIQHGEYTFGELPQVVQEKESKRLYEKVKEGHDARVESIPAAAREEFARAYESGDRAKIAKVLSKAEFARSLGSGSSDSPRESEHGQQSTAEERLERPRVRGQSAAAIAAISGETVADPVSTAPLSPVELSKAPGISAPSR